MKRVRYLETALKNSRSEDDSASITTLPVIGVPVKSRNSIDGWDSVLEQHESFLKVIPQNELNKVNELNKKREF